MKASKCLPLIVLVSAHLWIVQAQPPQTQVGNIGGAVVDRDKDDGNRKREITLKVKKAEKPGESSLIDEVTIALPELSEGAKKGINFFPLTPDWQVTRRNGDVTFSGPATDTFQVVADLPRDIAEAWKKVNFKVGFGGIDLGTPTIMAEVGDPIKAVKPADAATFPKDVYSGYSFSFDPKEGYRDGKWSVDIGGAKLDANPALTSDDFNFGRMSKEEFEKRYGRPPSEAEIQQGALGPRRSISESRPETFAIPENFKVPDGVMNVEYKDQFGNTRVKGTVDGTRVRPDPFANLKSNAAPRLIDCTPKIFLDGELCVCGYFPTEYIRGQLLVDRKRVGTPTSGSLGVVTFVPKGLTLGEHEVTFDTSAFGFLTGDPDKAYRNPPSGDDKVKFIVLKVVASIDRNLLFKKGKNEATLVITIGGTTEPMTVNIKNKTPGIVQTESGDFKTSGGPINKLERKVKGLEVGEFDIQYTVNLGPCPCSPEDLKTLAGEIKGAVGNTTGNPPADQNAIKRPDCERILSRCKTLELELTRLESAYQQALANCRAISSSAFNLPACLEKQRARFEPRIAEARGNLFACYGRYQECVKPGEFQDGLKTGAGGSGTTTPGQTPRDPVKVLEGPTTSVTPPPVNVDKPTPAPDDECTRIGKECDEIFESLERAQKFLKESFASCEKSALKEYPDDEDKRRKFRTQCQDEALSEGWGKDVKRLQEQFDACQKRRADCLYRARFGAGGPTTGTAPPPMDPQAPKDKESEKQDCEKIAEECNQLQKSGRALIAAKDDALQLCVRLNSDQRTLERCKNGVEDRLGPEIRVVERKLIECRQRLAACRAKRGGQ